MLHLHRRHGSSKFFLAVSASLLLLCMTYIYVRDIPLPCEGPGGILPGFGLPKQLLTPQDQIDQQQPQQTTSQNDTLRSRIAKVTVAANALKGGIIHRAIQSHRVQNEMHGYQYFIAENQAVSELIEHDTKNRPKGAWTKPAFLLSVLVAELEKDEKDRLEWILYVFSSLSLSLFLCLSVTLFSCGYRLFLSLPPIFFLLPSHFEQTGFMECL